MTDQKPANSENAIAQQTQEKFQFYLLSLVFTLLALSIQTAKFEGVIVADILELTGWVFFIVSGIFGLSRMEWVSLIRIKIAQKHSFEEEIFELKRIQLQGQTELLVLENNSNQAISDRIENRKNAIDLLNPYISKLERKHYIKGDFHNYCFVLGVLCVIVARAYTPALSIYYSLFS
jgi:hypothetical protein